MDSHCEKQYGEFLKKSSTELPYDPEIPPLDIHPREIKAGMWTGTCTPVFKAALLTIAKKWKHIWLVEQMNRYTKCVIYIPWNIVQP